MSGIGGTVGAYRAEGDDGPEIDLDEGGEDIGTADHIGPSGVDCPPLPGDFVVSVVLDDEDEDEDTETLATVGYSDDTPRVSADGEARFYSRSPAGAVTAEIHLKGDGSVEIKAAAGSTVTIDVAGAIKISGSSVSMQTGAALGSHFLALHAAIVAWTPVVGDGGAALKAALIASGYTTQTPPGP